MLEPEQNLDFSQRSLAVRLMLERANLLDRHSLILRHISRRSTTRQYVKCKAEREFEYKHRQIRPANTRKYREIATTTQG